MQLEYRVEADDYLAFNLHVMRTSPVFRAQAMRQRVVAAVTSTVIAITATSNGRCVGSPPATGSGRRATSV